RCHGARDVDPGVSDVEAGSVQSAEIAIDRLEDVEMGRFDAALRVMAGLVMTSASGGAQAIHVGSIVEVARETQPRRFSEPHLAIQASDPSHLLASAFVLTATGTIEEQHDTQRCVTFASRDGGTTWSRHEFSFHDCGDPQIALLPNGEAVFLGLAEIPDI